MRCAVFLLWVCFAAAGGNPADEGYAALRAGEWEAAVAAFREALATEPTSTALHKDLGYTLLRIGDTAGARDVFQRAVRLDPSDTHLALEYAYLCHESGQSAEARRVFEDLVRRGIREAAAPFEAIDRPLRDGIERWSQAIASAPGNWTNHYELARLAETRGGAALAAEHYLAAWRLRPEKRSLLVDYGRVRQGEGRHPEAMQALLAASRGAEPHAAERARMLLPERYPYVYEFREALALDPGNHELRRELAYLLLEMGRIAEAEAEFAELHQTAKEDRLTAAQLGFLRLRRGETQSAGPLLQSVLASGDDEIADRVRTALGMPLTLRRRDVPRSRLSVEARTLAERSLAAGYLKDALKYLQIAHENDPVDFTLMLKLGWTSNQTGDDASAVRWFNLAAQSPDPKVSAEAAQAGRGLGRGLALTRTSAWVLPFYSSRWRDLFSYGQVRLELKKTGLPLRPYLSARFIGDTRGAVEATQAMGPQYLSERSVIAALGVTTNTWRGATLWGEAGWAMPYVRRPNSSAKALPDYRGGLAVARGFGHSLAAKQRGPFFEANGDAVFVSRFGNDTLFYLQNRAGYTLPAAGGSKVQVFWNGNFTSDVKRQQWANFAEHGPGVRVRFAWMPPALSLTASALEGAYTIRAGSPQLARYRDVRAGFWYAFSY